MNKATIVSEGETAKHLRYVVEHAVMEGWEVANTILGCDSNIVQPLRFSKLQEAVKQLWDHLQDVAAQSTSDDGATSASISAEQFRIVDIEKGVIFNVVEQNRVFYIEFPINQTCVRMTSLLPLVSHKNEH